MIESEIMAKLCEVNHRVSAVGDIDRVAHGRKTMSVWADVHKRLTLYVSRGGNLDTCDFNELLTKRPKRTLTGRDGLVKLLALGILDRDEPNIKRAFISEQTGLSESQLKNIAARLRSGSLDWILGFNAKELYDTTC